MPSRLALNDRIHNQPPNRAARRLARREAARRLAARKRDEAATGVRSRPTQTQSTLLPYSPTASRPPQPRPAAAKAIDIETFRSAARHETFQAHRVRHDLPQLAEATSQAGFGGVDWRKARLFGGQIANAVEMTPAGVALLAASLGGDAADTVTTVPRLALSRLGLGDDLERANRWATEGRGLSFLPNRFGIEASGRALTEAAIPGGEGKPGHRTASLLSEMGKATYQDFRHPEENPGYLALDLLAIASAGAGAPARLGAVGKAATAARAAGGSRRAAAAAAAQRMILGPEPKQATLRMPGGVVEHVDDAGEVTRRKMPDLLADKPLSPNALVQPFQRARAGRLNARLAAGPTPAIQPRGLYRSKRIRSARQAFRDVLSPEAVFAREYRAHGRVDLEGNLALLEDLRHAMGNSVLPDVPVLSRLPRKWTRGLSRGQQRLLQTAMWEGDQALNPARMAELLDQYGKQHETWLSESTATLRARLDELAAEPDADPDVLAKLEDDLNAAEADARKAHGRQLTDLHLARQELDRGALEDPRFQRTLSLMRESADTRTAATIRRGLMSEEGARIAEASPAAVMRGEPLKEEVPVMQIPRDPETGMPTGPPKPVIQTLPGKLRPGRRQAAAAVGVIHRISEVEEHLKSVTAAYEKSKGRTRPRSLDEARARRDELGEIRERAVQKLMAEHGHPTLHGRERTMEQMERGRRAQLIRDFQTIQAFRQKGLSTKEAYRQLGRDVDPKKLRGARKIKYEQLVRKGADENTLLEFLGKRSMRGVGAALRKGMPARSVRDEIREHAEGLLEDLRAKHPEIDRVLTEHERLDKGISAYDRKRKGQPEDEIDAVFGTEEQVTRSNELKQRIRDVEAELQRTVKEHQRAEAPKPPEPPRKPREATKIEYRVKHKLTPAVQRRAAAAVSDHTPKAAKRLLAGEDLTPGDARIAADWLGGLASGKGSLAKAIATNARGLREKAARAQKSADEMAGYLDRPVQPAGRWVSREGMEVSGELARAEKAAQSEGEAIRWSLFDDDQFIAAKNVSDHMTLREMFDRGEQHEGHTLPDEAARGEAYPLSNGGMHAIIAMFRPDADPIELVERLHKDLPQLTSASWKRRSKEGTFDHGELVLERKAAESIDDVLKGVEETVPPPLSADRPTQNLRLGDDVIQGKALSVDEGGSGLYEYVPPPKDYTKEGAIKLAAAQEAWSVVPHPTERDKWLLYRRGDRDAPVHEVTSTELADKGYAVYWGDMSKPLEGITPSRDVSHHKPTYQLVDETALRMQGREHRRFWETGKIEPGQELPEPRAAAHARLLADVERTYPKPRPAPTAEGVVAELHPEQTDVFQAERQTRLDKIAGLEKQLSGLRRDLAAVERGNLTPRRVGAAEASELLGTTKVGADERLGTVGSALKDRLERLYKKWDRRVAPHQEFEVKPLTVEQRRKLEPAEGARYLPTAANAELAVSGRYVGSDPGQFGKGPVNVGNLDPHLTHEFTGDTLRSGKYRIDAAQLTVESGARFIRLASALDAFEVAWQISAPRRRSQFDIPVRSVSRIPEALREIVLKSDENLPLTQADVDGLSPDLLAALESHLHPVEYADYGVGTDLQKQGVRWVDKRFLTRMIARDKKGGSFLNFVDGINNAGRLFYVYGRLAYVLNLPGNMGMQAFTQGLFAPANYRLALKASKLWDEETYRTAIALVGEGRARALALDSGALARPTRSLANWWSKWIDRHSRVSSLVHEMRRVGVDVNDPAAVKRFLLSAGRQRTAVVRRANKNMVEFNNMTDVERNYVRHAIFIYPWVSRATVWALRETLQHPGKSVALAQLSRVAAEKMDDAGVELPDYLQQRGVFDVNAVFGRGPQKLVNPSGVNTWSTAEDNARILLSLLVHPVERRSVREAASPAADLLVGMFTGESSRGRDYEEGTALGALGEASKSLPVYTFAQRAGWVGDPSKDAKKPAYQQRVYNSTKIGEAAGAFALGGLFPRSYSREVAAAKVEKQKRERMTAEQRIASDLNREYGDVVAAARSLGYLDAGEQLPQNVREAMQIRRARRIGYAREAARQGIAEGKLTQRERLAIDLQLLERRGELDRSDVTDWLDQATDMTDAQISSLRRRIHEDSMGEQVLTEVKRDLRNEGATIRDAS